MGSSLNDALSQLVGQQVTPVKDQMQTPSQKENITQVLPSSDLLKIKSLFEDAKKLYNKAIGKSLERSSKSLMI